MKSKSQKRKKQNHRKKSRVVSKLIYTVLAAVVIGGLVYTINFGGAASNPPPDVIPAGSLSAASDFHNFGRISMRNGRVSHRYTLANSGTEPALIRKLYSS